VFPNTFYRVTLKAYITNDNGEILVTREDDGVSQFWALPGGGLDHGELPKAGLKRELQEELGVDIDVQEVAHVKTFYLDRKDAWLIWIVYRATLRSTDFTYGDVSEAKFINPEELADSTDLFEKGIVETARAVIN
jgi:mutator protein MutT